MPSPSLDLPPHIAPQPRFELEAELGASRPAAMLPSKASPPSVSLPRRAAERARGFASGGGLLALVTGLVFVGATVLIALLMAQDLAVAQDYAAAAPVGGVGTVAPPGADPIYFVWMAVAQALTGALALLVAWVQAGGKTKDTKIASLEQQLHTKDEALDAMRERAYTAEATVRALGVARSGEVPILPPPGAAPPAV